MLKRMDIQQNGNQISDLTIVIPTFNEGNCVRQTFEEAKRVFVEKGYSPYFLFVDDGSTDNSADVIKKIAEEFPQQVLIETHPTNRGLGCAIKTGFLLAKTEWVGWVPSDGQIGPQSLLALYEKRNGYQVVTGRVSAATRVKSDNLFRLLLSRGSRVVMKMLHPRMPNFNGIMILHKPALNLEPLLCTTGFVNMEILDRLRRTSGEYSRFEEEIIFRPRFAGHSKVSNIKIISLTLFELVRLRVAYLCGH